MEKMGSLQVIQMPKLEPG